MNCFENLDVMLKFKSEIVNGLSERISCSFRVFNPRQLDALEKINRWL